MMYGTTREDTIRMWGEEQSTPVTASEQDAAKLVKGWVRWRDPSDPVAILAARYDRAWETGAESMTGSGRGARYPEGWADSLASGIKKQILDEISVRNLETVTASAVTKAMRYGRFLS